MKPSSRDVFLPLGFYLALTLGVPLVRNGYTRDGFIEHAGTLIFVAAILVTARVGARYIRPTYSRDVAPRVDATTEASG
jgi:hypothetical protein